MNAKILDMYRENSSFTLVRYSYEKRWLCSLTTLAPGAGTELILRAHGDSPQEAVDEVYAKWTRLMGADELFRELRPAITHEDKSDVPF